jgi:DNA-binding transcriptional ArsR family regulator
VSAEPPSVPPGQASPWRGVHRALDDPLRIRLFEALWHGPLSVRELSDQVGLPPGRLYYHLHQLERAGIVEVAEYRPLPGGKVERVYRRMEAEPPGDSSSPEEVAAFLGSVLDVTRADINAAFMAKAAGERREVMVAQGPIWLTDEGLAEFLSHLEELQARMASPGSTGTQARLLIALVDLDERPAPRSGPGTDESGGTR